MDSITITYEGSGYTHNDFTDDGNLPIKIDGGGGAGAEAENQPTIDLVYIHAPGRVYINDCGEGIDATDFRFTVDTRDACQQDQDSNAAGGCIEMRGFTPINFKKFKKDKNRSVSEFLRILCANPPFKTPSYISFDGATQSSTTDSTNRLTTRQFSGLMITNRMAATIMPNTKSQFLLIKGEGEYWPDTRDSDNNTLSITFKLPAFIVLKGLCLHRPATSYAGLVSYQISLESTDGNQVFATTPPPGLKKDVGWDVYLPINKMLRTDTELRLRGSRAWRSPEDLLGCALLEIC